MLLANNKQKKNTFVPANSIMDKTKRKHPLKNKTLRNAT